MKSEVYCVFQGGWMLFAGRKAAECATNDRFSEGYCSVSMLVTAFINQVLNWSLEMLFLRTGYEHTEAINYVIATNKQQLLSSLP